MICPFCGSEEYVVKNGSKMQTGIYTNNLKRKRYKCTKCKKTFYDESEVQRLRYTRDFRIKLLAIMLKHSYFNISDLNQFFGYVKNSSEITLWENQIINEEILRKYFLKERYIKIHPNKKSYSYYFDRKNLNSKTELITHIENSSALKGVFIEINNDYTISDICLFDQNRHQ